MKYRIGICDDNKKYLDQIANIVYSYYIENKDIEIILFNNGTDVLRRYKDLDLILLDIEMPDMDGLSLKKKLEQIDFKGKIVYVTDYDQYMNEAFGKNVIAYIPKNNLQRVSSILKKIDIERKRNKILSISEVAINISDIYYLEADRGYLNIYTDIKTYYFSIYLNDILKRINDSTFVQVHRSYVVNLRYINTFNSSEITLTNGIKIKLSRKYKDEFKRLYFEYLKGD